MEILKKTRRAEQTRKTTNISGARIIDGQDDDSDSDDDNDARAAGTRSEIQPPADPAGRGRKTVRRARCGRRLTIMIPIISL